MSRDGEALSALQLHALLDELSSHLDARGEQAQLFVVGGAAMALGYDAARTTRDVDAVFEPKSPLRELAAEIGTRHGLDEDWLNDAAKGFMPGTDDAARTVYESESLLVQVPSARYLLAMKLHASRDERDLEDAAKLTNIAGIVTPQEAIDLLAGMYAPSMLLPRHRYVVHDVMDRAAALRAQAQDHRHPRSTPAAGPTMPPLPPVAGPSAPSM